MDFEKLRLCSVLKKEIKRIICRRRNKKNLIIEISMNFLMLYFEKNVRKCGNVVKRGIFVAILYALFTLFAVERDFDIFLGKRKFQRDVMVLLLQKMFCVLMPACVYSFKYWIPHNGLLIYSPDDIVLVVWTGLVKHIFFLDTVSQFPLSPKLHFYAGQIL